MRSLPSIPLIALLAALGCAGPGTASGAVPPAPEALVAPPEAPSGTGSIQAPKVVSAGMGGITAWVPVQAGATYAWSIQGGQIPGVTRNAAVVFTAGSPGTLTLTCRVTLNGAVTVQVQPVAVIAPPPAVSAWYGSGFGADSLANTQVGGAGFNTVSYRFQARHASPLEAIRVFFIWSLVKTGYHAGLGGTMQVDLLADDGGPAHLPAGPSLASLSYTHILAQNEHYPRLVFPRPVALRGGALYHLVFTNTDPSPSTSFVSLDCLYTDAQTAPMQSCIADAAWAVLVKSGEGAYRTRPGFTPTLELEYGDGGRQGNGYMEVWSTNPKPISGAAQVRQTFKVSGPTRLFSRVALRLQRLSGTGPLKVRIEHEDGSLLEEATLPASAFLDRAPSWATLDFPLTQALASGIGYHLVLSAPADTRYQAFPIRKGKDKGFSDNSFFPDGYAQFSTTAGASWAGWDMWGTPNLSTGDLQFMFIP